MLDNDLQADIKNLDYGQIYFRTIDRINGLSTKDYKDEKDKLFDFSWSVKMFLSNIPKDARDNIFNESYEKWKKKDIEQMSFDEKFDHWMELYSIGINQLARGGTLYRHVKYGKH